MSTILITGASGFIGRHLFSQLAPNHTLIGLSRKPESARRLHPKVLWASSIGTLAADQAAPDIIINLAGQSLAEKRWSHAQKKRIEDSRISYTRTLHLDCVERGWRPKLLLNASAIGIYGPHGDEALTETGQKNDSFSHRLCTAWENEAKAFSELGAQVSCLRFGVVLGRSGALPQLVQSFRYKVKTVMGSGMPFFSWVHIEDVSGVIKYLIETFKRDDPLSPAYNVTAPKPVQYKMLAEVIACTYQPWVSLPMPAPVVRCLLGEMADELILTGQCVVPKNLMDAGFSFRYPTLPEALDDLLPL